MRKGTGTELLLDAVTEETADTVESLDFISDEDKNDESYKEIIMSDIDEISLPDTTPSPEEAASESALAKNKKKAEKIMEDYRSGDDERKEKAIVDMWRLLYGYVVASIGKKSTYTREFEDILSECKCQIIEAMKYYDPEKGSPTTFFSYTIQHALSECKNKIQNKTPSTHFSNIANIVRTAMADLTSDGFTPTAIAIQIKSGLSYKQVETGLAIIYGADERSFESNDVFDAVVGPQVESTETTFFKQQSNEVWAKAFSGIDKQRLELFLKYNGIECSKHSYTKLAEDEDMSVKEVTKIVEGVRRQLYMNSKIRSYFGKHIGYNGRDETIGVNIMTAKENVDSIMSDFMCDDDDDDDADKREAVV